MDGFGLLATIMEHYPEIPTIVMTGYSTPELENLTKEEGATGFIRKPFQLEDLIGKISNSLSKESEGGTLHGISSGMFLQLIEMEQKTCTIRVFDKSSGKLGLLFFYNGELYDARADDLFGEAAAYQIFSWDRVSISIENACPRREKRIRKDLQAILMEAMRLKDEADDWEEPSESPGHDEEMDDLSLPEEGDESNRLDRLKDRLADEIGDRTLLEDIYKDNSWDRVVEQAAKMGDILNMGKLTLCYMDRSEENHFILLPGKETTVVLMNHACPIDRIIEVFIG
jgi:CheY-like chemotaxis protein